jgi:hypothetical protein
MPVPDFSKPEFSKTEETSVEKLSDKPVNENKDNISGEVGSSVGLTRDKEAVEADKGVTTNVDQSPEELKREESGTVPSDPTKDMMEKIKSDIEEDRKRKEEEKMKAVSESHSSSSFKNQEVNRETNPRQILTAEKAARMKTLFLRYMAPRDADEMVARVRQVLEG